jgi:ketol-acid reductoisomerase
VFRGFAERGFYRAVVEHGATAQYGGFLRTLDLDGDSMRERFTEVLADIRGGGFAERFQAEAAAGAPSLQLIAAMTAGDDAMSRAEESLRAAFREPSGPPARTTV